jgi:hypothetical protein
MASQQSGGPSEKGKRLTFVVTPEDEANLKEMARQGLLTGLFLDAGVHCPKTQKMKIEKLDGPKCSVKAQDVFSYIASTKFAKWWFAILFQSSCGSEHALAIQLIGELQESKRTVRQQAGVIAALRSRLARYEPVAQQVDAETALELPASAPAAAPSASSTSWFSYLWPWRTAAAAAPVPSAPSHGEQRTALSDLLAAIKDENMHFGTKFSKMADVAEQDSAPADGNGRRHQDIDSGQLRGGLYQVFGLRGSFIGAHRKHTKLSHKRLVLKTFIQDKRARYA